MLDARDEHLDGDLRALRLAGGGVRRDGLRERGGGDRGPKSANTLRKFLSNAISIVRRAFGLREGRILSCSAFEIAAPDTPKHRAALPGMGRVHIGWATW